MSTNTSPGLYVNEYDFTQYVAVIGSTNVCIIGGAVKGPLNKPTRCVDEGDFIQKFGAPLTTDYGAQAAVRILRQGAGYVVYTRIASSSATANVTLQGTTGGTAAVKATGTVTFTSSTNPSDADSVTIGDGSLSKIFEFDNNGSVTGGHVGVAIGSTALATLLNLINAINTSGLAVIATNATVTVPVANLTATVGGTASNVTVTKSGTNITVTGLSGGAAAIAGISSAVLTFSATSPGTWGNNLSVTVQSTIVPGAPANSFDVLVNGPAIPGAASELLERFVNVSLDPTSSRYVAKAINSGLPDEINASQYVTATVVSSGGTVTAGTFTLGAGGGTVGADGVSGLTYSDYVGSVSGQTATGLQAVANAETTEFNLLLIPGISHASVIAAAQAVAEARRDCVYVVDPPFGLSVQQASDWHNGLQPGGVSNSPSSALSSSYMAIFWSWGEVYDSYNKQNIWLPPSAFYAERAAATDASLGPWWAAAGASRGLLSGVLSLEYSPRQSERDLLNGDGCINPLVTMNGVGTMIYGDKTCQRQPSSLSWLHNRRLLLAVEKVCATAVKYLVFDPNDSTTWKKFEMLCNGALAQYQTGRGVTQFSVVCNAATNPSSQTSRGVMRGKLIIQPQDNAQRIVMDIAVTSTGTSFT